MKKLTLIVLFIFIGIYALLLCFIFFNSPTGAVPKEGAMFFINSGESLKTITTRLEQEKIIKSAFFVQVLVKIRGTDTLFKSGVYKILPQYSVGDIYDMFIDGRQSAIPITIPEGWTIRKLAKALEEKKICQQSDFVKATRTPEVIKQYGLPVSSVEGFLFPDTYFFPENYPAASVVDTMVSTFFKNIYKFFPFAEKWEKQKILEQVTLASIVEREYRVAEEASLIASVFKNRLKARMGLSSCATIEYIITEIMEKPHPKYITKEELKIDSPYNTYRWAGLPPGPISNPGRVALEAAFNTPETKYFYFVLKDPAAGKHFFSKDLEDHIRAKYYYLK